MALIIPKAVIEQVRFETNHPEYDAALLRLDPRRFRGLGPDHRRRFIRQASDYCDRIDIHYTEDVVYVMFLMSFLGSFFHEDFRYARIAQILHEPSQGYDDRIARARLQFIPFGDRFLGQGLQLYLADLRNFQASCPQGLADMTPQIVLDRLSHSHGARGYQMDGAQADGMIAMARHSRDALGLRGPAALNLCLALGYWLGLGFYKDPLFPWVKDKVAEGGEEALMQYTAHRLHQQIRSLEGRDG